MAEIKGKEKVTMMKLKVDLECSKCYKKVKKALCKFPQIRDQMFDEKSNTVVIKVVCCSPEKIMDKLCSKGGVSIKTIEIIKIPTSQPPPKTKESSDKPKNVEKVAPGPGQAPGPDPTKAKGSGPPPASAPDQGKGPGPTPGPGKGQGPGPTPGPGQGQGPVPGQGPNPGQGLVAAPKQAGPPPGQGGPPPGQAGPPPGPQQIAMMQAYGPPMAMMQAGGPPMGMYGGPYYGMVAQPPYECYGRPVYDSWGGGAPAYQHNTRCDYFSEENPQSCSIM